MYYTNQQPFASSSRPSSSHGCEASEGRACDGVAWGRWVRVSATRECRTVGRMMRLGILDTQMHLRASMNNDAVKGKGVYTK
jgi:hypothetical protein